MGGSNGKSRDVDRGAYGVRVRGFDSERDLVPVPAGWPLLSVQRDQAPCPISRPFFADDELLELQTTSNSGQVGGIRVTRRPLEASFTSPDGFTDEEILHPDLGAVAAMIHHWAGRDAFHAGAFVTAQGAWAVMGERKAGKSSLMALLASRGHGILSDDVVILDEDQSALAGPRCIDLREGAAMRLGLGTDIGVVGQRRRWRLRVPDVPAAVPLRGWVVPEWGDRVALGVVPVAQRPTLLFTHRYLSFMAPARPDQLLRLAALPFVTFRRPPDWDTASHGTDALVEALDAL